MTTPCTHENSITLAGVLGVASELCLTANGNSVATLIVSTNYTLRNDDGSTRQERERHRVIVWGMHAEKAARRATAPRSLPRHSTSRARTTRPRRRLSSLPP